MEYKYSLIVVLAVLTGCAATTNEQKHVYNEGYRAGVQEQVKSIAAQFQGGTFPYYHWTSPIVQNVDVPAHISNGVFIPAHKELVIIKPGEWTQQASYPIESQEEKYEQNVPSMDVDSTNITHLPNGNGGPANAQQEREIADSKSRVDDANKGSEKPQEKIGR